MRLVVVSGLSGAGKSIALNSLEDYGFYSIDNLPAKLLPAFADQLVADFGALYDQAAVGIDARNPESSIRAFPEIFRELRAKGIACELVFLEADDSILIKRFSETRRRHPLTGGDVALAEAIKQEREILSSLSDHADIRIDTSTTHIHQLRDLVRDRVAKVEAGSISLFLQSFGFKHGVPRDADFVFDVRCLPNPHWVPSLRPLTGRDQPVADYLGSESMVTEMYEQVRDFLVNWIPRFSELNRSYITVAIGCTGGQHRSVYLTERLARHFVGAPRLAVVVRHRELS